MKSLEKGDKLLWKKISLIWPHLPGILAPDATRDSVKKTPMHFSSSFGMEKGDQQ
jgi:hypothetical protein